MLSVHAQSLQSSCNSPRNGDCLVKHVVPVCDTVRYLLFYQRFGKDVAAV